MCGRTGFDSPRPNCLVDLCIIIIILARPAATLKAVSQFACGVFIVCVNDFLLPHKFFLLVAHPIRAFFLYS
jgi:hypothetical protein